GAAPGRVDSHGLCGLYRPCVFGREARLLRTGAASQDGHDVKRRGPQRGAEGPYRQQPRQSPKESPSQGRTRQKSHSEEGGSQEGREKSPGQKASGKKSWGGQKNTKKIKTALSEKTERPAGLLAGLFWDLSAD